MNSKELRFHELFNKTELEKALASNQKPKPSAPSTQEQQNLARRLFQEYPQLLVTPENAAVIDSFLATMPNPTYTYADFLQAYESETMNGRLVLNPSACGAGKETSVSGHRLRTHPNLYKLLAAVPTAEQRTKRQGKLGMSAEERFGSWKHRKYPKCPKRLNHSL